MDFRLLVAALAGLEEAEVTEWLAEDAGPLVVRRRGRCLCIDHDADPPLLEEAWAGHDLTAREQEVLTWVARGHTNAEIAETLWLSPGTVRKHLENAFEKLGVRTRTAAVARFLALGDGGVDQTVRPAQSS
jgi:DNA-binding CsgD family transcriptional regulator